MILSFDDYNEDNFKLAELAKEYGFKPIFFIDFRPEYYEEATEQVKLLSRIGFEIGAHTINHTHLTSVSKELAEWEIVESKRLIEELTGKPCDYFCYPRGRFNKDIINLVREAGYKYARTTLLKDGETPFEKAGIHITYDRKEYEGKSILEVVKETKLTHFWGHVFELNKYHKWNEIQEVFAYLKKCYN